MQTEETSSSQHKSKSKDKGKSHPVTEEELAAQQYLFEAAYNDIKGGQKRRARIQTLAKELAQIGYKKERIARAIVKKLTFAPLKITTDDYVRRVLGEEYKDYSQWGDKGVDTMKEKLKDSKPKAKAKAKAKNDELEIEKTKQDDKEITTVYLKKPVKKTEDEKLPKSIVLEKKIEADELVDETEIQMPTTGTGGARYTQLEAQISAQKEEIESLRAEKEEKVKHLIAKIEQLEAEVEELGRPYQQRQYITVTAGGETVIVAYLCVVKPKEKSVGIAKKSPVPMATIEEKKQDFIEWQKNLKPGRVSVDVNIDQKQNPTSTTADKSLQ